MLRLLWAAAAACLIASAALAHDDWFRVYEHNNPQSGRLCCGGSEDMNDPNADCEHLTSDQVHETKDGVIFLSRRYNAQVFVPHSKIEWDYPRDGYSKQVTPMSPAYSAGWCGKPRSRGGWGDPTPENPDPNFYTLCAFMLPGGT